MNRQLVLVVVTVLAGLAGCNPRDLCGAAASHLSRCTGQPLAPAASCDRATAERVLASPCSGLVDGKADDGTDLRCAVVDCQQRIVPAERTITRLEGALDGLVLYLLASGNDGDDAAAGAEPDWIDVALIVDDQTTLAQGEVIEPAALATRAATVPEVGGLTRLRRGGLMVFSHDDARHALVLDTLSPPTLTVAAALADDEALAAGPGELPVLDAVLAPGDGASFTVGQRGYRLTLGTYNTTTGDATTGAEVEIAACKSVSCLDGLADASEEESLPRTVTLDKAEKRVAVEGTLAPQDTQLVLWHQVGPGCSIAATPAEGAATVAGDAPAAPVCRVRLRALASGTAVPVEPAKPAALRITAEEPIIDAITGQTLIKGQVCNDGERPAEAATLSFNNVGADSPDPSESPLSALDGGACRSWTWVATLGPGNHELTVSVKDPAEADASAAGDEATAPEPLLVSYEVPNRDINLVAELDPLTIDQATGLVEIVGRVCNRGQSDCERAVLLQVTIVDGEGKPVIPEKSGEIEGPRGESCEDWTFKVTLPPGALTLEAKIDGDEAQVETKEDDNSVTQALTIEPREDPGTEQPPPVEEPAALPALMVKAFELQPGQAGQTGWSSFRVRICNRGSVDAPPFTTGLYLSAAAATQPSCGQPPQQSWRFEAGLGAGACEERTSQPVELAAIQQAWLAADVACEVEQRDRSDDYKGLTRTAPAAPPAPATPPPAATPLPAESEGGCHLGAGDARGGAELSLLLLLALALRLRRRR